MPLDGYRYYQNSNVFELGASLGISPCRKFTKIGTLFSRRERVLIKAKNNRCLRIIANMPKHTFALICNVHIHYQIIFESYYKFTETNFLT